MRRILLAAMLAAHGVVEAQDGSGSSTEKAPLPQQFDLVNEAARNPDLFKFAYSSPENIPFALLGHANNDVPRATDPKKFALGFLGNILGGEGEPIGMAIEFSPFWSLGSGTMSLETYKSKRWLEQAWLRSTIGAAFSTGTGAARPSGIDEEAPVPASSGTPSGIVLGWSTKLARARDPLMDGQHAECVESAIRAAVGSESLRLAKANDATVMKLEAERKRRADLVAVATNPAASSEARDAAKAELAKVAQDDLAGRLNNALIESERRWLRSADATDLDKALKTCEKKTAGRLAEAASVDIGIGQRWTGDPGRLKGLKDSGTMLWMTYSSRPLFDKELLRARLVFHGRYSFGEAFYDEAFVRQGQSDSLTLSAGIENTAGEEANKAVRWSLQGGYVDKGKAGPDTVAQRYWRGLAGLSIRISDDFWLRGSYGIARGSGIVDDETLLFGITFSPSGPIGGLAAALAGK
jgi:hypothetical protein